MSQDGKWSGCFVIGWCPHFYHSGLNENILEESRNIEKNILENIPDNSLKMGSEVGALPTTGCLQARLYSSHTPLPQCTYKYNATYFAVENITHLLQCPSNATIMFTCSRGHFLRGFFNFEKHIDPQCSYNATQFALASCPKMHCVTSIMFNCLD